VLVKYAVDREARAAFHAAKMPLTCDSGKSAPLFLINPVAIGVAAATAAAFCTSIALCIVRAPVSNTPGSKLWKGD
jgi:hypothetical protein